jgi:hypothetical protein
MGPALPLRLFEFCNQVCAHDRNENHGGELRNVLLQRITSSE